MENMSEILKNSGIPINISTRNTGTWSSGSSGDEASPPPGGDVCPICKGARYINPLLPTGEPDYSKIIACVCTRGEISKRRVARLQSLSNLAGLDRLTFDNLIAAGRDSDSASQSFFRAAVAAARKYAEEPQGWLVLIGPVGSGKTHLACAVANYRISHGYPAFYITAADLLDHLRSTYSPASDTDYDELYEQIKDSPLLILDNLNYTVTTAWAKGKLDQLLEYRFNTRLPTLITSSTPPAEFNDDFAGHINDPEISRVLVLKKESAGLLDLDSLNLERLRNMKFENFDSKRGLTGEPAKNLEAVYTNAVEFARAPHGWIIFQGENGCGKTHLAAAIANYLRESGREVLFIIVPDLLDHLRSSFNPDSRIPYDTLFERLKKTPVLVLDDFGEHASTPWAQEKLYQLINYRYNAHLPTVVTTCLDLDNIENRVSSRMVDPTISLMMTILAPDYRGDIKSSKPSRPRQRPRM
jgi:DNA replication protein DnaC